MSYPLPSESGNENSIINLSISDLFFTNNVKAKLIDLMQNNVQQIILRCDNSEEASEALPDQVKQLINLVKELSITVNIILPKPYCNKSEQKEIDVLVSEFIRAKSIATFQEQGNQEKASFFVFSSQGNNTKLLNPNPNVEFLELGPELELELGVEQTYQEDMQVQFNVVQEIKQTLDNRVNNHKNGGSFYNPTTVGFFFDDEEKLRILPNKLDPRKLLENSVYAAAASMDISIPREKIASFQIRNSFSVSYAAVKHIFDHYDQFQGGVDFNHLPRGFLLSYEEIEGQEFPQIILDYSSQQAALCLNDDPLIVSTGVLSKPDVLAHSLLDIYLEKGNKTKGYVLVNRIHKAICKAPYDKKAFDLLLQYLPILSNLHVSDHFDQIFFDEKDYFRSEAFDYLCKYVKTIVAMHLDLYKIGDNCLNVELINRGLNHHFKSAMGSSSNAHILKKDTKASIAVEFCLQYAEVLKQVPDCLENQLLYIFLKNDCSLDDKKRKTVLNNLEKWRKKLKLTQNDLNHLTQVYQHYGVAGVEKIFNLWETWQSVNLDSSKNKNILELLRNTCFKECTSYLPLLEPAYSQAIQHIQSFYAEDPNLGFFLETLITQHYAVVPDDDLPHLVDAFIAFKKALTELLGSNEANQWPILERPIKSLPVTLSRILSLLEHSRPEDRLEQWHCMGKLDFSDEGVSKAMAYGYLFVSPEMFAGKKFYVRIPEQANLSVKHLVSIYRNHARDKNFFDNVNNRNCVADSISDALEVNFFEYVAAQDSALSISFYQQATQAIRSSNEGGLHPIVVCALYRCLAAGTTNYASLNCNNPDNLLDSWKKFVAKFSFLFEAMFAKLPPDARNVKAPALQKDGTTVEGRNLAAPARQASCKIENLLEASIGQCANLPLPTMLVLMDHVSNALKSASETPASIDALLEKINNSLKYMAEISQFYQEVYVGLSNPFEIKQDSADADYVNVLSAYCDVLTTIETNQTVDDVRLKSKLVGLISIFQLKKEDIAAIMADVDRINKKQVPTQVQADSKEPVYYATNFLFETLFTLLLINSVDNKDKNLKPLSLQELNCLLQGLLEKIQPNSDFKQMCVTVCNLISEHLPNYYREECLASLKSGGKLELSFSIKKRIKDFFKDSEEQKLCLYFLESYLEGDPDLDKIPNILDSLLGLYETLNEDKPEIRKQLLTDLARLAVQADGEDETKLLYPLLVQSARYQQGQSFVYFMQRNQETNGEKSDLYLLQRVNSYLENMLQLQRRCFSLNVSERYSRLFEQLLLDPKQAIPSESLISIQNKLSTLVAIDTNLTEPLFGFLSAWIAEEQKTAPVNINRIENLLNAIEKKAIFLRLLKEPEEENFESAEGEERDNNIKFLLNLLYQAKKQAKPFFELIEKIEAELTQNNAKVGLLRLVTVFMAQNENWDEVNYSKLLAFFKRQELQTDDFLSEVLDCYSVPPYMSLAQFIGSVDVDEENKATNKSAEEIFREKYDSFVREPYPREQSNGFILDFALEQRNRFTGVAENLFSKETMNKLSILVEKARTLSFAVLQQRLNEIKQQSGVMNNNLELLACLAELLYRSNSRPGNSFELNTTQYLSVLSLLDSAGSAVAQVATGEGKSRIMMLLAASQFIRGNTTDVVSSDFGLAERDYLEYAPFFQALGAKTRLIRSNSAFVDYQEGAIHFTDITQLSHFRNRALTQKKDAIHTDQTKRRLLIDEVDLALFDRAESRFNYSSPSQQKQSIEWLYSLLVKFALEKRSLDIQQFIEFAKKSINLEGERLKQQHLMLEGERLKQQHLKQLAGIQHSQLSTWLESAEKAIRLKWGVHFFIKPDISQALESGSVITRSRVFVLSNNRVCSDSRYSSGVHECLEAFLEMQRCGEIKTGDMALQKVLSQCNAAFALKTEVQTLSSSNSYDLFRYYAQGKVLGLTGTLGSECERQEIQALYKTSDLAVGCIEAPRHKKLERIDKPIRLAVDSKRQAKIIMEYIQEAHKKGQPVLLISKNLNESEQLFEQIQIFNRQLSTKKIAPEHFQLISCDLPLEEERKAIHKAGQEGMITFGTSLLGRGIDIPLDKNAKEHGLLVLMDHLPSSKREYHQVVGRSGRYGAPGETRLVVTSDSINFTYYLNSMEWEEKVWQDNTNKKQTNRLLEFLLGHVLTLLQEKFSFNEELREKWSNFVKKYQTLYKNAKEQIKGLFEQNIKQEMLNQIVNKYETAVRQVYQEEISQEEKSPNEFETPILPLRQEPSEQKKLTSSYITFVSSEKDLKKEMRSNIYEEYDTALDGRSKVYSSLFMETHAFLAGKRVLFANTRAALRQEGILFADTRAFFHGKRSLFANTRYYFNKTSPTTKQRNHCIRNAQLSSPQTVLC